MVKIEKLLLEITHQNPKLKKETYQDYRVRLAGAADKLSKRGFDSLPEEAQDWVNDAIDTINRGKEVLGFVGNQNQSMKVARLIQIVPVGGFRLFGAMVKKECELRRKGRGTFHLSGSKESDHAKWSHATYKGWIKLQRSTGEVVCAEVKSLSKGTDQWQLLHAFVGFLERHFGADIRAINVQYLG